MEANVILSRCSKHSRLFGIRIEKRENDWIRTWAFKIDETNAKNEGFDKTKVTGTLVPDPGYPGCPYCSADSLVMCACGKLSCLDQESTSASCHWCGVFMGNLKIVKSLDVTSGEF